jgi:hypothetical protein
MIPALPREEASANVTKPERIESVSETRQTGVWKHAARAAKPRKEGQDTENLFFRVCGSCRLLR